MIIPDKLYNTHMLTTAHVLLPSRSLPSQYLYPLVENLDSKRRPVLFYDQLGCGKSDEPKEKELYVRMLSNGLGLDTSLYWIVLYCIVLTPFDFHT